MHGVRSLVVLSALLIGSAAFAQTVELVQADVSEITSSPEARDGTFDAMMADSMERMHRDMAVPPSGDPDRDFAAMMIPHHQGAVDMARIQLQFGKNPVLRRLAQAIIVEQLQEIGVMQRELQQAPPPQNQVAPLPTRRHH